jgi:hypothetical protein
VAEILPLLEPGEEGLLAVPETVIVTPEQGFGGVPPLLPPLLPQEFKITRLRDAIIETVFKF